MNPYVYAFLDMIHSAEPLISSYIKKCYYCPYIPMVHLHRFFHLFRPIRPLFVGLSKTYVGAYRLFLIDIPFVSFWDG